MRYFMFIFFYFWDGQGFSLDNIVSPTEVRPAADYIDGGVTARKNQFPSLGRHSL